MGLSITTRRLADGTVEISARGEIDVRGAGGLAQAVDVVLATSAPGRIRIELWQVTLIDSIATGTLVACYRTAAAHGVRLVLANPTETVHRQLRVSGLLEMFGLRDFPSPARGPMPPPPPRTPED